MNTVSFSTTSAAAISEMAQKRLRESPYFFLRPLTCHYERGVLTVRGRVPHDRLRDVAERIVGKVEGVQSINNQVEVCDPSAWARSA